MGCGDRVDAGGVTNQCRTIQPLADLAQGSRDRLRVIRPPRSDVGLGKERVQSLANPWVSPPVLIRQPPSAFEVPYRPVRIALPRTDLAADEGSEEAGGHGGGVIVGQLLV